MTLETPNHLISGRAWCGMGDAVPGTEGATNVKGNSSTWIVICRADRKEDGSAGDYELATRKVFETRYAAETYMAGISESREPLVIQGDFRGLRHD